MISVCGCDRQADKRQCTFYSELSSLSELTCFPRIECLGKYKPNRNIKAIYPPNICITYHSLLFHLTYEQTSVDYRGYREFQGIFDFRSLSSIFTENYVDPSSVFQIK